MARFTGRSARGRSHRGRAKRGGIGRDTKHHGSFRTSRLHETEDTLESEDQEEDQETDDSNNSNGSGESSSASEDDAFPTNSYSSLLQDLHSERSSSEPKRKRRRLNGGTDPVTNISNVGEIVDPEQIVGTELREPAEDDLVDDRDLSSESDSEGKNEKLHDTFEKHYTAISSETVSTFAKGMSQNKIPPRQEIIANNIKRTFIQVNDDTMFSTPRKLCEANIKHRLRRASANLVQALPKEEKDLFESVTSYTDVLSGHRTMKNAARLRDICALHALNHVFKIRDRVLKNNMKISQQTNADELDFRDQGFTRPKVIVIVPTKQNCVKFVNSLTKLSEPEQQENKSRFMETYSQEENEEWDNKPEDFRELFGGNHEEDFRIGLKFTRKTIKFFSGFYNSDIIIGSPLGLMRTITTGGGGAKDKKKAHDADFLSSVEVVIMDQTNALQMQNWQHVDYIFSQLNHLPKESHGCDFSRVRNWYLDGNAKYLRQTIILSSYLTPEINALASLYLHNMAGRVKYVPIYNGAMLEVSNLLPVPTNQTFLRYDSPSPSADNDSRFKYFAATILPSLIRDKKNQTGVLIFVPTYLDFVRLRNHFSISAEANSVSFGSISEYTEPRDISRARSHFQSGRHSILLYSERAHHHFRYRIRGVRKVIFYGVPENPVFWSEVVGCLGMDPDLAQSNAGKAKGLVRAIFSKWDVMKLERIVGTERVGRLVSEKGGDTFDFV